MHEDAPLVMATFVQVADRDGVSKSAVSKNVRNYADNHNLPVERDGRGRITCFSLAHYDHIRSRFSNPLKTTTKLPAVPTAPTSQPSTEGSMPAAPGADPQSLNEGKRQETWLKVLRLRLAMQEELGALVRRDLMEDALAKMGGEIKSVVSRLPNRADDLAARVTKDGVHGLRLALKDAAFEVAEEIAEAMEAAFQEAPQFDDLPEGVVGAEASAEELMLAGEQQEEL
ncbi:hypothetical protein PsW64_02370 [Pseudovibrio sp. W64]|uniref:hypothetical protein n=1 Tax=unclassified Pseudovibrio TaxID=2627060 RepID=UPI0007AE58BB|nr:MULTISPECIES: hypothetical protein [unclassified Pseudovibrio]KZK81781.1 hypothetical protein PsW64_02370 [Pseudovibrio sp. W64]